MNIWTGCKRWLERIISATNLQCPTSNSVRKTMRSLMKFARRSNGIYGKRRERGRQGREGERALLVSCGCICHTSSWLSGVFAASVTCCALWEQHGFDCCAQWKVEHRQRQAHFCKFVGVCSACVGGICGVPSLAG